MAPVILEHAVLDVVPGEEDRFEAAFEQARTIIASMAGFRSLRLERCLENRSRYLLLVEWDRLEDHTEGFRQAPEYQRWRALLHHFYDPFPTVEHYQAVLAATDGGGT
jgi:heme-degrading monooxygenase HmoA